MLKTESLKKLGILGVSFGLMASPLAFADMHEEDEPNTGTQEQEEAIQEEDQGSMNSFDSEAEGQDTTTYEEEQEDWEEDSGSDPEEDADW